MDFELTATTPAGAHYVELTEKHAVDFATRAGDHDRDGTFPFENFEAMKASGVLAAAIPEELGGLGVGSIHDLMVGTSRLARSCPATAISANMHIGAMWTFARMLDAARASGDPQAELLEAFLPMLAAGEMVLCSASTEAGASLLEPRTTATAVDGGYLVNGHKIFGTNSEIAGIFIATVRFQTDEGERFGGAVVMAGTPGMEVQRTWDALGMRASCSNDVVFTDCFVPAELVLGGHPIGEWDASLLLELISINFTLIGAYIGIAERARDLALDAASRVKDGRSRADVPGVRHLLAEIEVDLCAARASLARTAMLIDDYMASRPASSLDLTDLEHLVKDWQCSKLVVLRAAREIVDRAMSIAGGGSYMNAHPLARLWRDVRAGSFHQPFSPVEAHEVIARTTLGLPMLEG